MGDVEWLRPEYSADQALEDAKGKFDDLMVIGWQEDGLAVSISKDMTTPEIVHLMESVKMAFLLKEGM